MSTLAVYPGSFDPVTLGHRDIIERACRMFDRVIVAVSNNPAKRHTFSVAERIAMAEDAVRAYPQATVDTFTGLLVDFVKAKKANIIIRGMRVVSDMDYEFQLGSMNRRLYPKADTVFLMADEAHTYLSSSMVTEVARMGARIDDFVSPYVAGQLRKKFKLTK